MAIYRGPGGAGDATADASNAAALADSFADAANASAGQAAASAASALAAKVAAELAETNAELAETNAETAEAAAEAVLTDAGFIVVAADLQGTDTIGTVATNIANVNAVGNNIANVNAVNANATNINIVAADGTDIGTVAGISANVTTVATNNANVTTVATNIASVNTNATNIANINQNAANIVAIQNASANATAAASSATAAAGSATSASASAAAASAVALGSEPVRHSVRPSLLLDFANTKTLDPRITFTRASTGTFYDGKTVAKAEENLISYSQEFENASWTKTSSSITANSSAAPDGTTTADTLTASAGTSVRPGVVQTVVNTASVLYTSSVFVKAGTHTFIQLYSVTGTVWHCNFDVTSGAGAVGTFNNCTGTIVDAGNGWYRCIVLYTPSSGANVHSVLDLVPASNSVRAVQWNPVGTETILLWGAQLEQRSSVTAYTATTTAPITNYIPALQSAASGVARFEHNPTTGESLGLEIEEQRTNLVFYSEQFDNAAWTKAASTITANAAVAPDGTLTADKFVPDSTAASHTAGNSVSVTSGTSYTVSAYFKSGEYGSAAILLSGAIATTAVSINLSTGVTFIGAGSPVNVNSTSVGNGWWRLSFSVTATSTTVLIYNFYAINGTTWADRAVAGNGFSGIYIWGAQLEAGSFATSYIPTVASQVTRSADSASMTGTNFSSWYRADEGTFYGEASPNALTSDARYINVGDTTNRLIFWSSSSTFYVETRTSGTDQASLSFSGVIANTAFKFAGTYKVNDFAASRNATTVQTDTLGTVPVVSQMSIGSNNLGGNILNGNIKKLAYYPKRLQNSELVALTTI